MHYFNKLDNDVIMYSMPRFKGEKSDILFNSDGTFHSILTNNSVFGGACINKTIEQ